VYRSFYCAFVDNYLELVKDRAYGIEVFTAEATDSARAALWLALDVLLRLLAPVLPFACEEVWSWWREGSVHRATWPTSEVLHTAAGDGDPSLVSVAGSALAALRKVKSEAKVSQRTEFASATLLLPEADHEAARAVLADLRAAGRVAGDLTLGNGTEDVAV